ncbi:uncharacterized protein FIBRA_06057 [Fibroporia radiculosa]|uniref:Uncharacterized protein n=1 Tax=Fibroporia radiculosa TaxID=599839 RepID=J4IB22_9APHY|nr:uncharacterized protein FIBRA_06057 [Fibroporia radiculosa]CCM03906.1 predicted protein [Fibroporia radiculosa]
MIATRVLALLGLGLAISALAHPTASGNDIASPGSARAQANALRLDDGGKASAARGLAARDAPNATESISNSVWNVVNATEGIVNAAGSTLESAAEDAVEVAASEAADNMGNTPFPDGICVSSSIVTAVAPVLSFSNVALPPVAARSASVLSPSAHTS